MNRNLKVLGLSLAAVLAFSAVLATTASAKFTSTGATETILSVSANQPQVFHYTAGGAKVECQGVTADESKIVGTSQEDISAVPTFSNCKGPLNITAHVTNNGCTYTFTTDGTVHVCSGGGSMTIVVTGLCTYHIGPQTVTGTTYENVGSPGEVTVTPNATGIEGTNTNPGAACGPESSTTGTYSGDIKVKGTEGETQVGVAWDKE